MAVPDSLQKLLEDGVIDDIKTRLMSGKEATVYVVERQGELIAAKIYKSREQRTFKATAAYTEGRNQTRNSRDKRAMGKRTAYGKDLVEKSWRDMEFQALSDAWNAGVRVPEPILLYDDVLLMQLLVDELGNPAPRLADFDLPSDVAELLHREIYGQVRLLLVSGKVHGDLSAFNILIAEGGPTIIDMPQVVDASGNQSAAEILRRDLANVTEHLAKFDARLLRFRDCGVPLWRHYERGTLDSALDPEEGSARGDAHRSRRVRDAERGRMGRDPGRPGVVVPVVAEEPRRGSPQQQHQQQVQQQDTQARAEQRPPRPISDEPRRGPPPERRPAVDDRGGPPPARLPFTDDRRPQQQERRPFGADRPPPQERRPFNDDRRPAAPPPPPDRRPFNDDRPPVQSPPPQDRRPFNDDRRPQQQQQQPQQQHDRRPFSDDRRPQQQQQDRRPFNDDRQQQQRDRRPFNDDRQQQQQDRRPFNDDRRPPQMPQHQQDRRPFSDDRRPTAPPSQQEHRPFSDERPIVAGPQDRDVGRRPFGDQRRRAPPQVERRPSRADPGEGGT